MSELAEPGHGASIAMEMTPLVSGVFTVVPEIGEEISWPEFSTPETNVTTHDQDIDSWIPGVPMRGPFTFSVYFRHDNAVHQELQSAPHDGVKRGWRLRGRNGSAGVDEVIASGFIQSFGPITHPPREGVRKANVVVRFSGPYWLNGVQYGTS
jgi:hypothetical protein